MGKRSGGARARRALIGSMAAACAGGPAAHASAQEQWTAGGGAFVGYRFGSEQGIEWGFEGFGSRLYDDNDACSNGPRYGVGPLLQVSLTGLGDPRITVAMQAGGEFERAVSGLTGELGLSYRPEREAFGLHLGITPESLIFNASFRYQMFLNDAFLGAGVRLPPTYGVPSFCSVGRPLRTRDGIAAVGAPVQLADTSGETHAARVASAGRCWAHDAQLEYASVPAFLALADDLSRSGAPTALVGAALSAARDELHHAALCSALASRHLDQMLHPVLPEAPARAPLSGTALLQRLALESWLDGCLTEGIAAAQAALAAQLARDRQAQRAQQRIAHDEHRHAELAWRVLHFAVAAGGDDVRDLLSRARDVAPLQADGADHPNDLCAHGRLDAARLNPLAARHTERAKARLAQALCA